MITSSLADARDVADAWAGGDEFVLPGQNPVAAALDRDDADGGGPTRIDSDQPEPVRRLAGRTRALRQPGGADPRAIEVADRLGASGTLAGSEGGASSR